MNTIKKLFISVALIVAGISTASAAVNVTGTDGVCNFALGTGHKAMLLFFDDDIRNVIATNNEYQESGGSPIAGSATNIAFDVWAGGECVGNVHISIDPGTNESAQFALEDYLDTPNGGAGVLVRQSGSLDNRGKIDIYIDSMRKGKRTVMWNNFVGMPNTSRLMSSMRFLSGQHLGFMYTGASGSIHPQIQIFRNDGTFVGYNDTVEVGFGSAYVTDNTRSLSYKDMGGNPIDDDDLPADGEGYLKVLGLHDSETFASCMILYSKVKPNDDHKKKWKNSKLRNSTMTYARRNGGNDPLQLGQ